MTVNRPGAGLDIWLSVRRPCWEGSLACVFRSTVGIDAEGSLSVLSVCQAIGKTESSRFRGRPCFQGRWRQMRGTPAHTGAYTSPPSPKPRQGTRELMPQDYTIETPQHGWQRGEIGTAVYGRMSSMGGHGGWTVRLQSRTQSQLPHGISCRGAAK